MEQEKENGLTVEEICRMMKLFDQSSLQSFLYQREGEKLKMSRRPCDAAERSGDAGQGTSFTAEMGQKEKARIPETAVKTEEASSSAARSSRRAASSSKKEKSGGSSSGGGNGAPRVSVRRQRH